MVYQLSKIIKPVLLAFFLACSNLAFSQAVNAGTDQTICSNSTTLSAISNGGVWTTTGYASITNPSSQLTTVTNLDQGANIFTYTISGEGADDVIITNNMITANAGNNIPDLCSNTYSLNGTSSPVATSGTWSLLNPNASIIIDNTAQANTTVRNLPFGTTILVWTVSANGCSDTDEIDINSILAENNNSGDQALCSTTFYLGADAPPSGASGNWSVVSSPGLVSFSLATDPAVKVTAPIGSSTVRWTITSNGCPSTKDYILTNNLTAPNAGTDFPTCFDDITLNASVLKSGETGVWSVIDPQSESFSHINSNTTNVSNVKQGTTTFVWTVSNAFCSVSDQVQVVNNRPDVDAGPDQTICTNSYTLNANNPLPYTGTWTSSPAVGFNNANLYNATISGLENNSYTLTWTVVNGVCTATDQVVIHSNYTTISSGTDISDCSNTFSITGTPIPSGGSGYWTRTFGDGTIDNSLTASTTVRNISSISRFKWTILSGICTFTDEIELVNQLPSQAVAQADKSVCTNETIITGSAPVDQNEAGAWTKEITCNATIVSPSLFQTQIKNLDPGQNTFTWTISNQHCSTSDVIVVTNNQITTEAGPNQTKCSTSATLSATNGGGTGYWSSTNPSILFSNSASATSSVSNLPFGANTLTWTRNDLGCTASDQVVITNNLPADVYAGDNQIVCEDRASISAANPPYGSGTWSVLYGTGTFDNNASYQTDVNNISLGLNTYKWTINYLGCGTSDEVDILNRRIVVSAGANQTICNQLSANLSATPPTSGQSGTWSIVGGGGSFSNITLFNTSVSSLVKGINTYKWTLSDNWCSNASQMTVVNNTPDSAKVEASQVICTNYATISAVAVTNGTGSWSLVSGSGIIQNTANNVTQVTSIGSGINTYKWTVTKNNCPLSANLTVTNNSVQAIIPASQQTICNASHGSTLTATQPTEPGAQGVWTKLSTGTANILSPSNYQTSITGIANGDIIFKWTVWNANCSSSDEITVTNNYYTASAAPVGSPAVCVNYLGILGNVVPPSGTGAWTANSTQVTFDNVAAANTYARNLPTGTSNLTWTITKDGCAASANFNVTNNQLFVSAGQDIVGCASSQTLNADALGTGQSGSWSASNVAVTFVNSTNPATTVNTIPMGTSLLTWTITANGCSASDDVLLTNNSFYVDAGNDKTICGSSSSIMGTDPQTNGTGTWTVLEGGAGVSNPNSYLTNVTNLSNGANRFKWTVIRNSCQATDEVVITNDLYVAQASAPAATCVDEVVVTATALPAGSGATGKWTTLLGGGKFDNANIPETTVKELSLGSNRFRWTVTKGTCTDYVNIDVMDNRVVADAGVDQITCDNYSSLFASPLSGTGTGAWTCNIGTVNIETPTAPFSNVTNLNRGDNTFTWTVNDLGCSDSKSIVITNNSFDANAGTDQEVIVSEATMNAGLPVGATGEWSVQNGNGTFVNQFNQNAVASNLGYGKNSFRWTVNYKGCSAYDDVEIVYNVAKSFAGYDQVSCNNFAQLNADQPAMGKGVWTTVDNENPTIFENSESYNTRISNVPRGTNVYRWTVTAFESVAYDDVSVTNYSFDISAGADQQTCETEVQLNAQSAGTGTGNWSIYAGSGTFSDNYNNEATVNNMFSGINLYVWQVTINGCTSTDTVEITHYQPVTQANAGQDAQFCDQTQYTLAGNLPDYGNGTWSSDNIALSFDQPQMFNSIVRNLPDEPVTIWWTIANDHCNSADDIVITAWRSVEITSQPATQEINEGGTAIFAVETSGSVESYQWQKNGLDLEDDGRITGTQTATLNISNLTMHDGGQFKCVITGHCNNLESEPAILSILLGFEDLSKNGIKIYPNPSKGMLTIDLEKNISVKDFTVARLNGEKVLQKSTLNNKETIDLSQLADGIYLIYFNYGNELIKTKLIIQK